MDRLFARRVLTMLFFSMGAFAEEMCHTPSGSEIDLLYINGIATGAEVAK